MEELSIEDHTEEEVVSLQIVDATTEENNADIYTVFHLQVSSKGKDKVIKRRFRQFQQLNNTLAQHFSGFWEEKLPAFPSTYVLMRMDEEVVAARKVSLEDWLKKLQKNPTVFSSFFVSLFLERISVKGKVAMITGGNSGLGFETAKWLTTFGAHVILACRSAERGAEAVARIQSLIKEEVEAPKIEAGKVDLASLHSIQEFATQFKSRGLPLHILINNAASMGVEGLTADGFEYSFGVNYLGHYLLTKLLLDVLHTSAPARIVNVVGNPTGLGEKIPFAMLQTPATSMELNSAYNVSKLAMILWSNHLSEALKVNAVFPGYAPTELYRQLPGLLMSLLKPIMKTIEETAANILFCAIAPEMDKLTGLIINEKGREQQQTLYTIKESNRQTLITLSESWVNNVFMASQGPLRVTPVAPPTPTPTPAPTTTTTTSTTEATPTTTTVATPTTTTTTTTTTSQPATLPLTKIQPSAAAAEPEPATEVKTETTEIKEDEIEKEEASPISDVIAEEQPAQVQQEQKEEDPVVPQETEEKTEEPAAQEEEEAEAI